MGAHNKFLWVPHFLKAPRTNDTESVNPRSCTRGFDRSLSRAACETLFGRVVARQETLGSLIATQAMNL